jgi:hypothetical protein
MRLDDIITQTQSQSCALSGGLGGKKWLKYFPLTFPVFRSIIVDMITIVSVGFLVRIKTRDHILDCFFFSPLQKHCYQIQYTLPISCEPPGPARSGAKGFK